MTTFQIELTHDELDAVMTAIRERMDRFGGSEADAKAAQPLFDAWHKLGDAASPMYGYGD